MGNSFQWLLAACLVLSGCVAPPVLSPTPAHVVSTPLTQSVSATFTPTLSPTQTASPTVAPTPADKFIKRCVNEQKVAVPTLMASGSLIVIPQPGVSFLPYTATTPYLLAVEKEAVNHTSLAFSPREGNLAWVNQARTQLEIKTTDGKTTRVNLEPALGWHYFWQWVTPRRLLIPANNDYELSQAHPPTHEFYLISADDGAVQHHVVHLPRTYAFAPTTRGWVARPIYNPTLAYALYAWHSAPGEPYAAGLLLWDTQREKIVWEQGRWGWELEDAGIDWSPNGDTAVVTAPPLGSDEMVWQAELLEVSTTGVVTQLTHLSQRYAEYVLRAPKWSPHGRYIAFTYQYQGGTRSHLDPASLFIYDTQTQTVIDYCFDAVRDRRPDNTSALWWSPASDQLAFEATSGGILVVDVATGNAERLPYTLLLGWVPWTSPP